MNDPAVYLSCAVLGALVLGAWLGIRECANAVLHDNRDWWKKALYLAKQRASYRQFCKELEEVKSLERMGAK